MRAAYNISLFELDNLAHLCADSLVSNNKTCLIANEVNANREK
jgi:hypothetical protein